jgi:hypothetical protein
LEHLLTFWVCGYTGRLGNHYIAFTGYDKRHVFVPSLFCVLVLEYESDGRRGRRNVEYRDGQCTRQSPSLDNHSAFLGASTRIHCPAMHHSHIRVLLRHSVLRASPHAGNQPHQRVCVLGANPAPSHTAAGAQYISQ